MNGFEILDLLIGIFFVYFLLSIICCTLQEIRAGFFNLRSQNLKKWIIDTFNINVIHEQGLGNKILSNITIDGLTQCDRSSSYLTNTAFVGALLEEIHKSGSGDELLDENNLIKPYSFESIKEAIKKSDLVKQGMKQMLLQFHAESFQNLDSFREKIGSWFDEAMARNGGTFKKKAQLAVLLFSIVVTIGINVDSLKLIRYFYENPDATRKVADAAERITKDQTLITQMTAAKADTAMKSGIDHLTENANKIADYKKQLDDLHLPIGWDMKIYEGYGCLTEAGFWPRTIIGWLMTILAVSLGAPFWFDLLNKVVNLRSAGRRVDQSSSPDTGSSGNTTNGVIG